MIMGFSTKDGLKEFFKKSSDPEVLIKLIEAEGDKYFIDGREIPAKEIREILQE